MCPKIKMGGGKNGCGQGSKWGGKIFWKFFRGGEINFPRHFHSRGVGQIADFGETIRK